MMEDFSGGYYRIEMNVQPFDDGPSIEKGLYNYLDRKLYQQTDAPVTMRIGLDRGVTFHPVDEGAMPRDVLALPEPMLDMAGIHPSAESVSVFIVKPAHAYLWSQAEKLGEGWLDSSNISDMTLDDETTEYFDLGES